MKPAKPHKIGNDPIDLRGYFGQEYLGELYEKINRPVMLGSKFGIHLRVLNNWMNVLDERKTESRQKYSFVQYAFFKIVEQLRELEVSLPFIKAFKEHLLQPQKIKGVFSKVEHTSLILENSNLSHKEKERLLNLLHSQEVKKEIDASNFSWLHLFIMYWVLLRKPVNIAIFKDGTFKHHTENFKINQESFIVISISGIMRKFLLSDLANDLVPQLEILNRAENKIFDILKRGSYESMVVFYVGYSTTSTLIKKKEIKEEIVNRLLNNQIEKFEIKTKKGETIVLDNKPSILL